MTFHFITLFPGAFDSYLGESILKRAIEDKKIAAKFYNPRDYSLTKFARVDDKPYGGGPGMVIEALPVIKAIEKARAACKGAAKKNAPIIWLIPSGVQFDTEMAQKFAGSVKTKGKSAAKTDLIIVCGRYEGIDARVKKVFKTVDISVGPFVLTGGELPAMIIVDCVARQIPGVLGSFDSLEERRVSSADVYTRPETISYKPRGAKKAKKYSVPKVLLSGNPKLIDAWKQGLK